MNKIKLSLLATAFALTAGLSTLTLATTQHERESNAQQQEQIIDIVVVLQNIKDAGYVSVNEIRLEHNSYYTVQAFTKAGVKLKFLVDAMTGKVPAPSKVKHISTLEVAQKVEAAGYHSISRIKLKHDHFDVDAMTSQGTFVKLWVDPITGIVSLK